MADKNVDVARIRKLIQEAEVKAAKAQGVLDNLEAKWKERYGDGSLKTAKEQYAKLQADIAVEEKVRDELLAELEEMYDWDSLEE